MPRLASTPDFVGGIIYGRIEELQGILNELQAPTTLTLAELERMRERIDLIDAAIRSLRRENNHQDVRKMVDKYENRCKTVIDYLERREQNAGRPLGETEAHRAAKLRHSDLDMYATDRKHKVPMQYYSVVQPTSTFQPVSAKDLREQLNRRREGEVRVFDNPVAVDGQRRARRGERTPFQLQSVRQALPASSLSSTSSDEPLYGGERRLRPYATRRQREESDSANSIPCQRARRRSPSLASTVRTATTRVSASTTSSYRSATMKQARGPQYGVPLPPFANGLPYRIQAGDAELIGKTEIFVATAEKVCPMCRDGGHRMFQCTDFTKLILVDRWHQALSLGVCLHCLRRGHSSFRCEVKGHCERCKMPHNSLLCPRNPANSDRME